MEKIRALVGATSFRVEKSSHERRCFLGTAFAIGSRHIATCRHVLEQCGREEPPILSGQAALGTITRVLWKSPDDPILDFALGELMQGIPSFTTWINPQPTQISTISSKLTCFGYGPGDGGLRQWEDNVSGIDLNFGLVALQNSLLKGVSGGPAIGPNGTALGVVVARDAEGAQKYVLPFESVYRWMEDQGYRPSATSSSSSALLSVPIGPAVRFGDIPEEVLLAFARQFSTVASARAHIAKAMRLAADNHPETNKPQEITIDVTHLNPMPEDMTVFWSDAFSSVGKKSRRSVAALLDVKGAPLPDLEDADTANVMRKFRQWLSSPSH